MLTTAEHTVRSIGIACKHQHRDCLVKRVHDPILRDARLCVVPWLFLSIAFGPVWVHNFYHDVSTEPKGILIARVW